MDSSKIVRERNALLALAVLFVVCTAFILSHPHSFERATVPDERSYYGWAKLYNQGVYHLPLYDWYGVQAGFDYYVNSSGLYYLRIEETLLHGGGGVLNLEVRVRMQDDTPVAGAEVRLSSPQLRADLTATTNASGAVVFSDMPRAPMSVAAHYFKPPSGPNPVVDLAVFDQYDTRGIGEPYQARIEVSYSPVPPGYQLGVRVVDSLDDPVPGVNLSHLVKGLGQKQAIGTTDSDGRFTYASTQQGSQVIIARKDSKRGLAPIASVVPYGGSYVVVNHWAPGYSIILGILDMGGIAEYAGILMMGLALVATYFLARRFFGWKVAFVSGVLLLTCAVALLLVWTSGMADYASMAFALAGIWLLVEAVWPPRRWFLSVPLGFLGGAAFGVSVWIRYSTASLLLAVAFLLFALSYRDWKELRAQGRQMFRMIRRFAMRSAPFALGLILLLVPLAVYNSTYFGGPLGASHNYGGQVNIESINGNTTASVTAGNVYSNFDPAASITTMTVRLHWLLLMMPILLLLPAALYIGWRQLSVLFLLALLFSNLFLYLFVPWVASWWDAARSMEDCRYFLPALPPAAMIGGMVIAETLLVPKRRRVLGLFILISLVIAGFAVAQAGIGYQMDRLKGQFPGDLAGPGGPPPLPQQNYTPATVSQLMAQPATFSEKLVEVRNCTFDRWVTPAVSFLFRDSSSPTLLRIELQSGYTPPALSPGTLFHVKGVFHWVDGNSDSIPQPPEIFISVKAGTTDSITLA